MRLRINVIYERRPWFGSALVHVHSRGYSGTLQVANDRASIITAAVNTRAHGCSREPGF